ncbi:ankyrin repeat-containing domain protein, partial [Leptodontidium sp. 2 PMI_412]
CDWGCDCSCHRRYTFISTETLNPVLGSVSIEVVLPKTISGPCNQYMCRRRSSPSAQIDYVIPSWLIMAMVSAKITIPSLHTCNITLRAARIVPDNALLFRYAMENNLAGIKELFDKGLASAYDVDQSNGTSALVYATDRGHIQTWRYLLKAGADPYLESKAKQTNTDLPSQTTDPTTMAAFRADFDMEEYLETRPFPALHRIVLGITEGTLHTQLKLSTSEINAVDCQGRTVLAWAAIRGDDVSLNTLLDFGADPNLRALNGDAPLHYAVRAQSPGCVEPLIEKGANVNAQNAWKVNPLCYPLNCHDLTHLKSPL